MKKLKPVSRAVVALSALLMISAYFVPLWQILMWAPQYPEGLAMKIWIDNITGDVKIISALNHYIGMKHIEVSMFPEFQYMIYVVAFVIFFGLVAALANRRAMLVAYCLVIIACGVAALVDFYIWGYNYGHNLDPTAPIVVPGMSYQPPLIGTKQLLNFTAYSGPDIGGWIFFAAGILAIGILAVERYSKKKGTGTMLSVLAGTSLLVQSCGVEPEPIHYGKDACHECKMTLMDNKFGCEIVSRKGKIYKFDDVNCMLNFYNNGELSQGEIAHVLTVDYAQPSKLIDARNAWYLKSEAVKSPMASNVAAFEKQETVDKFNGDLNGILLSWGELQTQFK